MAPAPGEAARLWRAALSGPGRCGRWRAPRRPRLLSGHHPPFKKLFFHLERLCVAMKTDFPRGPTLPSGHRTGKTEMAREQRQKEGRYAGGREKKVRPVHSSAPSPKHSAHHMGGVSAARAPGNPPARSPSVPRGPEACLPRPAPDPRPALGALAPGLPAECPAKRDDSRRASRSPARDTSTAPESPGRLGSWPCPVSFAGSSGRTSAQTGGKLCRVA